MKEIDPLIEVKNIQRNLLVLYGTISCCMDIVFCCTLAKLNKYHASQCIVKVSTFYFRFTHCQVHYQSSSVPCYQLLLLLNLHILK